MTSITSLAPELLSAIVSHLPRHDLTSLLRVDRHFHDIATRQLWRTLYISGSSWNPGFWGGEAGYSDTPLDARRCEKLVASGARGLKYTRRLVLLASALKNGGGASALLEMVKRGVESGEMRLLVVEIVNLNVMGMSSDFLSYLKTCVSSQQSCSVSIELKRAFAPSLPRFCEKLPQAIDLSRLTALDLEHRPPDSGEKQDPIMGLTGLLSATKNLTRLQLEMKVWWGGPRYFPQEPLRQLQSAVTALSKLRFLDVSGPLFHPSSFLAPPVGTTSVKYSGTVSFAWWRQLARCPFEGTRELELNLEYPLLLDMLGWASLHEEETAWATKRDSVHGKTISTILDEQFLLGDVMFTGLEWFRMVHNHERVAPVDVEECVVRRNPRLARGCVKSLRARMKRRASCGEEEGTSRQSTQAASIPVIS
ncbi:hypothetical protein ABW21_db0207346 [Orbilia brochopaga]|nr:hypothetical protein ABW21_db0207346 [Drechslerella brochopaga]